MSLQPGTVIAGRYEVVKCLGTGSMGLVYACRHRELPGHMVAVKVLFPEVAQDKVAAARFRNEIFASYGVSHPNVVRAYEYLRDGELLAYTMEYVGGGDLAEKLSHAEEKLSISEIIRILSQICSGVQAIHDAGIVHRDLKPENILLTKEGNVKITDFGIARMGQGQRLTEHGGVVGTINYVSPEYMLRSQVDWRSDIYAIGILGYEMVTGTSPFQGDSVVATMTKRLKSDPSLPSSLREDCPKELDEIILHAMARDPEARYPSAAQMWEDLYSLATKLGIDPGIVLRTSSKKITEYSGPVHQSEDRSSSDLDLLNILNAGDAILKDNPIDVIKDETVFAPEMNNKVSEDDDDFNSKRIEDDSSNLHPKNEERDTTSTRPIVISSREDTGVIRLSLKKNAPISLTPPLTDRKQPLVESRYDQNRTPSFKSHFDSDLTHDHRLNHKTSLSNELAKPIELRGGSIDPRRINLLNQEMGSSIKPVWIDILVMVFAVIIGIGVAVTVIKSYFPDLLGGNKPPQSGLDINILAEKVKD